MYYFVIIDFLVEHIGSENLVLCLINIFIMIKKYLKGAASVFFFFILLNLCMLILFTSTLYFFFKILYYFLNIHSQFF